MGNLSAYVPMNESDRSTLSPTRSSTLSKTVSQVIASGHLLMTPRVTYKGQSINISIKWVSNAYRDIYIANKVLDIILSNELRDDSSARKKRKQESGEQHDGL